MFVFIFLATKTVTEAAKYISAAKSTLTISLNIQKHNPSAGTVSTAVVSHFRFSPRTRDLGSISSGRVEIEDGASRRKSHAQHKLGDQH